jgi:hypothetical protein
LGGATSVAPFLLGKTKDYTEVTERAEFTEKRLEEKK